MGLNLMLHQEWREGREPEIGFEVEKKLQQVKDRSCQNRWSRVKRAVAERTERATPGCELKRGV